ncbi:MAG: hypothetical protein ACQEXJ_24230 [Myxococcota bacterium]
MTRFITVTTALVLGLATPTALAAPTAGCPGHDESFAPAEASAPAQLKAYDAVRAALADDDLDAARAAAGKLAEAAKGAKGLEGLASDAATVKAAGDLKEARQGFGQASRHLLAWLAEHPDAAEGVYAFQCPMAKPYGKWVQLEREMANPYMGKKMLHCGKKTEVAP